MVHRPVECRHLNYVGEKQKETEEASFEEWGEDDYLANMKDDILREKEQFEARQDRMDRRAGIVEISLGALIACIIIGSCAMYLRLYNQ